MDQPSNSDGRLRRVAEFQLLKRQDFAIHVAAYLAVNVLLVAIWAFAGGGEFGPLIPIVVWGAFVALHAWAVFGRHANRVADPVDAEIERLRAASAASS